MLDAGFEFATQGGYIDFTASTNEQIIEQGEIPAAKALAEALAQGIDIKQLTMSSDGNASLPLFDQAGELIDLQVGEVKSLHQAMVDAVKKYQVPLESALSAITSSPASILKLKNKGLIVVGLDADLNLLDRNSLTVHTVIAKGKQVIKDGKTLITTPFG